MDLQSPISFFEQSVKRLYQCLEPSTLVLLRYEHIQKYYDGFPSLERYGRLIAEEVLKSVVNQVEGFQFLQAEERYLEFVTQYPDIFNRVSLTHLATYLGIERPSLSRIRKKLAKA